MSQPTMVSIDRWSLRQVLLYTTLAFILIGILWGFLFVVRERVKMVYPPSLKTGILRFESSFLNIHHTLMFI
jgi:hypothetical protein